MILFKYIFIYIYQIYTRTHMQDVWLHTGCLITRLPLMQVEQLNWIILYPFTIFIINSEKLINNEARMYAIRREESPIFMISDELEGVVYKQITVTKSFYQYLAACRPMV